MTPEAQTIRSTEENVEPDGASHITLHTDVGEITCLLRRAQPERAFVLFASGVSGNVFEGPARGLYRRLADELVVRGVSSLRVRWRHGGNLEACVSDCLTGLEYVATLSDHRLALVGHSFGGAVVIQTAVLSPIVAGVISLAGQSYGADRVSEIAPRPMLFIHGTADNVIPHSAAIGLHKQAGDPKRLVLLEGAGHGLGEQADEVASLVENFVLELAQS